MAKNHVKLPRRAIGRSLNIRANDGNVKCRIHGPVPGYFTCSHILEEGAPIVRVKHPTKGGEIGQLLCGVYADANDHSVETETRIICAACAIDRKLVGAPGGEA